MKRILASVGRDGENHASDVRTVQDLLNKQRIPGHMFPLRVDGIKGPLTVTRIESFQRNVVKMGHPNGRVDPEGKTFELLQKNPVFAKLPTISNLSKDGTDLLQSIEVLRLNPYDDQTGKEVSSWIQGATIGYGHLIGRNEWTSYKNGVSAQQAETLFTKDLLPYVNAVKSKVTSSITQNQFDALVILTFNIGIIAFSGSSVLKLVNDPSAMTGHLNLEAAWKSWNRSQGNIMSGLNNRRNAEWDIYSRNVYHKW